MKLMKLKKLNAEFEDVMMMVMMIFVNDDV